MTRTLDTTVPPRPVRAPRGGSGGRRSSAATTLWAQGEPMVWLTGGGVAIGLIMIIGLLALVAVQGFSTFWPTEIVRVATVTGQVHLGEVTRDDTYRPEALVLEELPPEAREPAREALDRNDGVAHRRLIRTGNYELTNEHFNWVSDFAVVTDGESRPDWALLFERQSWGRFYGLPRAFLRDGEPLATEEPRVWELFERHHPDVRARWEQRRRLEQNDIGRINHRLEEARLEQRSIELEHGVDSAQARAARERLRASTEEAEVEFERIRERIRELDQENDRFQVLVVTADGTEKALPLAEVVRAYPANRIGLLDKIGIYLSRWHEFLTADPREANSEGGVFPAIFGTVVMTLIMSLLVVPFGVLAALYLREYAKGGALVSAVRIAVNNLAGVPSIVFGVFGLGFFCYIIGGSIDSWFYEAKLPSPTFGTGGILWASLTLALLTLPVVIVATEEALAAVPGSMREGSYACGASKWQTIRRIVLPRAMPGIMTGMILAMARGAGEVAPLMLVGAVKLAPELPVDGIFPFVHAERSFMHLGFHIYDLGFQSQNSEAAKPMVYTTTLLLISVVAVLNLTAIWLRTRLRRRFVANQF